MELSVLTGIIPPQDYSIEAIAGRFYYYEPQLQILYLNSTRIQERQIIQDFYNFFSEKKDDILDGFLFNLGQAPKPFKVDQLKTVNPKDLMEDICSWSHNMYSWCDQNGYCIPKNGFSDIYNEAEKAKYLLGLV